MNLKKALIWGVLAGLAMLPSAAFAQTTPPPRLTPAEVKRGWFENRRIMVEVMTDSAFDPHKEGLRPGAPATFPFGEHFGIRIGNVVPMRLNIYVLDPEPQTDQRKIEVDFSALKRGSLSIDTNPDPDFKLVSQAVLPAGELPVTVPDAPKPVLLKIGDNEYPADLYEIRLYVATARQPQPMRFAIEFAYAAEEVNGSPDWKRLWTPEYILSMSRTADDGSDLSAGNTAFADQNPPVNAGLFLVILGTICLVTPLAAIAIRLARSHLTSERRLDPEERAWLKLDPILEAARREDGYEFSEEQVRGVVGAILSYIGKPALSSKQIDTLKYEDDDGELLIGILRPLMEGVLEGKLKGEKLSNERYAELIGRVEQLIPRP